MNELSLLLSDAEENSIFDSIQDARLALKEYLEYIERQSIILEEAHEERLLTY